MLIYYQGSFRGVRFEVEDHSLRGGRRLARHEFPYQDEGYIEDMGRKLRDPSLTCFVIGDDYMARRDALIAAAETEGPGVLVHPWLGLMEVYCEDYDLAEASSSGGMAIIHLVLVEAGKKKFPTVTSSPAAIATINSVSTLAAVAAWMERAWDTANRVSLVISRTAEQIADRTYAFEQTIRKYSDPEMLRRINSAMAAMRIQQTSLAQTPALLATSWQDALDNLAGGSIGGSLEPVTAMMELWQLSFIATQATTTADEAAARQCAALQDQLIVCTLLGHAAEGVIGEDYAAYDDALAAASALGDLIYQAQEQTTEATVYMALDKLRADMLQSIQEQAIELPRVRVYTPPAVTSVLELGQLFYGDGSRTDDPIARNNIFHPGFIPAEEIKMLSK